MSPSPQNCADLYRLASKQSLGTVNNTFYKMMTKSKNLCKTLGSSGLFVSALITRVSEPVDTMLLMSNLKMLQLIHQHHIWPRQLVLDHNMYSIVRTLAETSFAAQQVIVYEKCKSILIAFQLTCLS